MTQTLCRHPHPRFHPLCRRAVRHLPVCPARRRGHQGRAESRRRHAALLAGALGRVGAGAGALLSRHQQQQAQHHARPRQTRGRSRSSKRLAERSRHRVGEFPPRHHGALRARLRNAARAQPAPDLLRGVRLRSERPGTRHRRLRRQIAGDVRHHVDHRARGQRPDPRRLRAVRHDRRDDRSLRRIERAVPAHADRRRPVCRRRDARRGAELPLGPGRRIHRHRPHPPAVRQPVLDRQGHRQPLQGRRGRPDAGGDDRTAVRRPDARASAAPMRSTIRALPTGRRGRKTRRPCAASSKKRWPATPRRIGRSG